LYGVTHEDDFSAKFLGAERGYLYIDLLVDMYRVGILLRQRANYPDIGQVGHGKHRVTRLRYLTLADFTFNHHATARCTDIDFACNRAGLTKFFDGFFTQTDQAQLIMRCAHFCTCDR